MKWGHYERKLHFLIGSIGCRKCFPIFLESAYLKTPIWQIWHFLPQVNISLDFCRIAAPLFMGHFESKLISNFHLKPKVWLRFIDDIFLIWTHGDNSLLEFVKYANSTHRTIKLTSEYSTESIVFLDTRVKISCTLPCTPNLQTPGIFYTFHQHTQKAPKQRGLMDNFWDWEEYAPKTQTLQ